jgi:Domain of unknown function (DUF397)
LAERTGAGVSVRNSRDLGGPALIHMADEIEAFIRGVAGGDFDNVIV